MRKALLLFASLLLLTGQGVAPVPGPWIVGAPSGPAAGAGDINIAGNYKKNGVTISAGTGNPTLLYAASNLPAGYTFGKLTGGNPSTFASLGISLATAQAAYGSGIVTSTAQYVDDVVVKYTVSQATTLYATQGYTCVVLPPGNEYWDQQVTYSGAQVCLIGSGNSGSNATTIFTQTVGAGTAALHVTGGNLFGKTALSGVSFAAFNSGLLSMPGGQAGVAAPGGVPSGMTVPVGFYWYTGAIALELDNTNSGVMQNVSFFNYDTPHQWTDNVYIWKFVNFTYGGNNKGGDIEAGQNNSFERMVWSGGSASNNNYGFYLAPGAMNGSLFIQDGFSIDYDNVYQIYYDGGANSTNDLQIPLYVSNSHIETNSSFSGTANCRILNGGILVMTGNKGDEEGSFPVGWVCPTFYARTILNGNMIPGLGPGGAYLPAVYSAGSPAYAPTGSGNSQRYGGDILLFRSGSGDLMGGPTVYPSLAINASYSPTLAYQLIFQQLSGSGQTITIPTDAASNHVIGTVLRFEITDANTWTVACAGPPTCTGTLTGIGGAVGTQFTATKTGANAWVVLAVPTAAAIKVSINGAANTWSAANNFTASSGVTVTTPGNIGFELLGGSNGGSVLPVPTFYPVANNTTLAFDLSPHGTPTDLGYGAVWNDMCTTDQITSGASPTVCLHLSAGTNPSRLAIASAEYSSGTLLPLYFGTFNGDSPAYTDTFVIKTNATFQELNGYLKQERIVTASGTVTVAVTDHVVLINKTVGAATAVSLFATPAAGTEIVIKDMKGDAGANNITITPAAGNIDGAGTVVINSNFGKWTGIYNGTSWSTF